MGLRDKYKGYPVVKYRVVAAPGRKKGKPHICCLCGKEFYEPMLRYDCEVVCSHCTMGMADAIDTKNKTAMKVVRQILHYLPNPAK